MLSLQGYYDGMAVQTLEKITAKKNSISARGSLAKYANTALWKAEGTAWEKAVGDKYGNA